MYYYLIICVSQSLFQVCCDWYFRRSITSVLLLILRLILFLVKLSYLRFFFLESDGKIYIFSSSLGTRSSSIGFAGCIWCYIRRTHWPAIRNWRFYQAVLLWACLIAPTIFRGKVHDFLCPPSTCVYMCAVKAGGCIIDLLSRARLPPALYCAWSQETIQTQIICMSPPVPFVYPRIWHGGWETGDTNYLRHSHTFFGDPPRPEIEPGSPVW